MLALKINNVNLLEDKVPNLENVQEDLDEVITDAIVENDSGGDPGDELHNDPDRLSKRLLQAHVEFWLKVEPSGPPLLTAALGQPATFACAAAGHPLVDLHWLKDGQPVRGGSAGGPAHTLSLHAVAKDDEGMYQCFVKNDNDMAQGTAELRLGDIHKEPDANFILLQGDHVNDP
ncbi:Down syndrome cell adhesion molecule-like protein Dscam2 [Gryllus bimaculatus]|nr:Down syndrome cell adhesion molecule-like protein Dscam2 [Gryllus bimaculatus]